jgi:mannose-1-phosphate guanylyltransferase
LTHFNAFVLAAGFGTRLHPLTEVWPKPLVPVCGVPLLRYALAQCAQHGLTQVIVNSHWLAEHLEPYAGSHEGVHVSISRETPNILGTGGGLRRVRERLARRFVVLNGDVLNNVDLTALLAAIPQGGGALALRANAEEAPIYGIVAADSTHRVVKLREIASAPAEGALATDTHFTGIHAMDRLALNLAEDDFSCIIRTAYKQLVPQRLVSAIRHGGTWLDVGDPKAYLDANLTVLNGDLELPLDPFPRAQDAAKGSHWIGSGAVVKGHITQSVIGANAIVPADATLDQCVVWDNLEVPPGLHRGKVFFGLKGPAMIL